MKVALAVLIFIHGLIHVLGFLKAFGYGQLTMLSGEYSRFHGLLWLLASILFMVSLVLFSIDQKAWPWIGLAAVILSQVLIVLSWTDAKYGTWANLLLLAVFAIALAEYTFERRVEEEVRELYRDQNKNATQAGAGITKDPPEIVERWVRNSGIGKYEEIQGVHLKQKGEMRTKPGGNWMPFTAEQWFSVKRPGFVWKTRVQMMGPIFLSGRDKLLSGKGNMDISLLSLFPLVRAGKDPKIDQGTLIRFMAETCWFPSAAYESYLSWEPVGELSARAYFTTDERVTGIFNFNPSAEMISFEGRRYRGSGEDAKMETWVVKNTSFAQFDEVHIPNRSEVYWIDEAGEFHWLSLEITEISYDAGSTKK